MLNSPNGTFTFSRASDSTRADTIFFPSETGNCKRVPGAGSSSRNLCSAPVTS
mgnify:CR=1 FL=1